VILVDANILIYASDGDSPHHARAHRWLEGKLNGTAQVGLPWTCLLAFMRIVTNPRVMARPATMTAARAQVRTWLECDSVWIPSPGERHAGILDGLLASGDIHGNLVMDAHLAALAIEHGLEICSADTDFVRFPNIRWTNPLTV
jgi:toxin-antitoxin system PIN domain toxin